MDQKAKSMSRRVEDLDLDDTVSILKAWNMEDFVDFVRERELNGRKLLEVTEGIVKLWRPKANAKKFILFVEELKLKPEKYIAVLNKDKVETEEDSNKTDVPYQTVSVKRGREQNFASSTVEDILKKIVPAKSFLYRHQATKNDKPVSSYVPMEAGTQKKSKKIFRLSSYEYPHFDTKQYRHSKNENFNDRGYYSIKTNTRYYIQKTCKKSDAKPKYKSLSTAEELDKFPEEHFYEDLNYNDMDKEDTDLKIANINQQSHEKPYKVKLQELFQSIKLPFFKRAEEIEGERKLEGSRLPEEEKDGHIYENSDSLAMYDSVHVNNEATKNETQTHQTNLPVEDYLEPVQLNKDYCDVMIRQKDDSILGYIMSLFENRFGIRRETNDSNQTDDSEEHKDPCTFDDRIAKCPDEKKPRKTNMADRPLPVPVENEPFYMNIDRSEAENLLKGQPDGTFILRPSSQPNHAYTLTVSCSNAVHNVGVRRRPDGRLALGYARRGERSFASVTSLLRHHKRRRLLLVAGGSVCGATTLNETPQYYQTPSNLPLS